MLGIKIHLYECLVLVFIVICNCEKYVVSWRSVVLNNSKTLFP